MKVKISNSRLYKIRNLLYVGFTSTAISVSMNGGKTTEGTLKIRDKCIKEIMDLLTNK